MWEKPEDHLQLALWSTRATIYLDFTEFTTLVDLREEKRDSCGVLNTTKGQEIEVSIARHRDDLDRLLHGPTYEFSRDDRKKVRQAPGVYLIHDNTLRQILYVGESDNLQRRLFRNHRSGNRRGSAFRRALSRWKRLEDERKIKEYIVQNCSFQTLLVKDKLRRKRLEHFAIAVLNPVLNDVVKLGIV